MAWEIPGRTLSFPAGVDLTGAQYTFVELKADGTVGLVSAAGAAAIGVLQNTPDVGETAEVMLEGVSKVVADAAIANVGTVIAASADGQAAAGVAGNAALGRNMEAASAAGVLIAVLINCYVPADIPV